MRCPSFWRVFGLGAALLCAGCAWVPDAGPLLSDVEQEANQRNAPFALIKVDQTVLAAVTSAPAAALPADFTPRVPAPLTIGSGDVLAIDLYEAGPGGAFAPSGLVGGPAIPSTPSVTSQVVDEQGDITFPFAGRVHLRGLTVAQAEALLRGRLEGKMVAPQVAIHVTTNAANVVTLTGAIKTPGRPALTAAHERIIDLIAAAGGPTILPTDTSIRLTRGGRTVTVPMETLLEHPEQDFPAEPGDVIELVNDPRTFVVAGATLSTQGANKLSQEFSLDVPRLTLAGALARAGGIVDDRGNARAVLVMRDELPAVLQQIPTVSGTATANGPRRVIYAFDLMHASGYFLANDFPVRPHDMIFVPNARLSEIRKVSSIFTPLVGPATFGASVSR